MKNKISVIMSLYKNDSPEYAIVAIDSILKQDVDCDIFIYRDGKVSVDLQAVLDFYSNNVHCRIFESDENKGLAFALNYLIERSLEEGYEYIARMDSDDISHPQRLKTQMNFMETCSDIHVLGTSCHEFGAYFALDQKHLPVNHKDLLKFSIIRCPFIHPSVMFRRKVFDKGFRYPMDTTLTEDMALWFYLLQNGFRFANINEVLLDYRLDEQTIYRRKGFNKALSEIKLRSKYMKILKQTSLKNIMLIYSRILFHLMPANVLRMAYKWGR
jgi:hypothetical protein